MLGAVVGPLIAVATLALGFPLVVVLAVSFLPSLLSVVFILALTRDRAAAVAGTLRPKAMQRHGLPRRFWIFLVGVLLFGLGDFSRTFLIFLVAGAIGGSASHGAFTAGVLAYTCHNAVSGLAAFQAGRLGDRMPKWKLLAAGYALGVVTNLTLAGGRSELWMLSIAIVCSGAYIAVEETVEKAAVAELLPREQRSLGFGILATANAVGDMISSLYVGTLLAAGRGTIAFAVAAALGALGAVWIFLIGRGAHGSADA
jgi:MFS family permease